MYTVDFFDARLTDAPAAARLDLDLQLAAALGGEFLAIVEPHDTALAKQHRRRDHWPRQRPATRFVDPDDHRPSPVTSAPCCRSCRELGRASCRERVCQYV